MIITLPRDMFNVSKLLKCLGRIELGVLDGLLSIESILETTEECIKSFDVDQTEDGDLYVSNISHYDKRGEFLFLRVPYNSKEPWPLIAYGFSDIVPDIVNVFHHDGQLTEEFINEISNI